jgi:hypothetical protein
VILVVFGVLAGLRIAKGKTGDFEYVFESATAVTRGENIYHYGQGINPYPPLTAAWVSLLVPLGERGAAAAWLPLNLAMLGAALWLGAKEVVRRLNIRADRATVPLIALLSLVLVSEQAMGTIRRGNKDVFLLLPIVLALRWVDRRALLAGALLAIGASVKYLTIVFLPYFILRGRFKAAAGFGLGWLVCFFGPALVLGWDFNLRMQSAAYAGVARMLGVQVDNVTAANAAPHDLEVTGASALQAVRRLGEHLGWSRPVIYACVGVVALACLGVVWGVFRRGGAALFDGRFGRAESSHERERLVLLDWLGVTTAMLAFSLHLETRHTVMLAPVYATAAAVLVSREFSPRWPLLVMTILSYLAYRLPPGDLTPELMQQWRFIGGSSWALLVFLVVLAWTVLCGTPRTASGRPW